MLSWSLCDYSNVFILVKRTIIVANTEAQGQPNNVANKKVIFKNCAPFINCIIRINNAKVDDTYDIDIVMPMYNLVKYSDNHSKTYLEFYDNIAEVNWL